MDPRPERWNVMNASRLLDLVQDLVDEEQVTRALVDPEIRKALTEQCDALDGKKGALLWAVSASDGSELARYPIAAAPVFPTA